ncbi:MAG TPA: DUF1405 domain-containing protein [Atribacteraceae bacterium]|nr:DUF1405 domain-containing protein [Atribacteraceae bacterium]
MKNRFVAVFYDNQLLFWLLVVGNILSAWYGYTVFYGEQLLATPWYLWIFIPDCPLFSTLFVIAFILVKKKIYPEFLLILVIANSIKYALWTVTTIPLYSELYLNPLYPAVRNTNLALIGLHVIMGVQSLLLYPFIRRWHAGHLIAVTVWLYVNDLLDYGFNLYPNGHRLLLSYPYGYLPGLAIDQRLYIILTHNLVVNTAFLLFFWWIWKKQRNLKTSLDSDSGPEMERPTSGFSFLNFIHTSTRD